MSSQSGSYTISGASEIDGGSENITKYNVNSYQQDGYTHLIRNVLNRDLEKIKFILTSFPNLKIRKVSKNPRFQNQSVLQIAHFRRAKNDQAGDSILYNKITQLILSHHSDKDLEKASASISFIDDITAFDYKTLALIDSERDRRTLTDLAVEKKWTQFRNTITGNESLVSVRFYNDYTPLILAAAGGDLATVKYLLKMGAIHTVHCTDTKRTENLPSFYEWEPVMFAAYQAVRHLPVENYDFDIIVSELIRRYSGGKNLLSNITELMHKIRRNREFRFDLENPRKTAEHFTYLKMKIKYLKLDKNYIKYKALNKKRNRA